MLNLRGLRALETALERCFAAAASEAPPLLARNTSLAVQQFRNGPFHGLLFGVNELDAPRVAGGLVSGAASKAVVPLI